MTAVKISAIVILLSVIIVVIRRERSDFAFVIQISAVVMLVVLSISLTEDIFESLISVSESCGINNSYIKLLIKTVGIAAIVEMSADVCRDSGNSALAFSVELIGKIIILSMSFPMLETLCNFTVGLLK